MVNSISWKNFIFDEKFSEFLHYYTTGRYAEHEVELILNGDILNFLQIDYHGHYLTVITEPICMDILHRIVAGHPIFFNALKDFAAKPGNSITYVVGNHDQAMLWPATRNYINEVIGSTVRLRHRLFFRWCFISSTGTCMRPPIVWIPQVFPEEEFG